MRHSSDVFPKETGANYKSTFKVSEMVHIANEETHIQEKLLQLRTAEVCGISNKIHSIPNPS